MTAHRLDTGALPRITRREVVRWAGLVATVAVLAPGGGLAETGPTGIGGYGRDPELIDPKRQLWPRLLTGSQRETMRAVIDDILPANEPSPSASQVGVLEFFEEWLSAPYPVQVQDRMLILPLLDLAGSGADLEALATEPAWERIRILTAAAYFTTPQGLDEMGFVGNSPLAEFEGVPADVKAALDARYDELD